MTKNKGAITITLATVLAGGTILVSVLVSYFGVQVSANDRVAEVEGNIKVLQNEDININKRFDDLNKNLKNRFDNLEKLIERR